MSPNTWPVIDAGVRALEKGTCLQFVDYTNQRDYIGNFRRFSPKYFNNYDAVFFFVIFREN